MAVPAGSPQTLALRGQNLVQSLGSRTGWQPVGVGVAGHERVQTTRLTTLPSLQVPLPSSVFINTTESYEVER